MSQLRDLVRVASRPRWALASRGPLWHRFYSTNPRRATPEPSNPPFPTTGTDRYTLGLVVTAVAGLVGYGVSKFPGGDANTPKDIAAILAPERIPTVRYATLDDMKKVNSIQTSCSYRCAVTCAIGRVWMRATES